MDEEEERLVLLAQAGHHQALDLLLRRYEQPLFRHVHRMVGNEDASYEALQETYLAIVRNLKKLRSRSSFRPWAYGVATRVCLKTRSRWARRWENWSERGDAPDPRPLPEMVVATQEEREELMDHVQLLSPKVRSVILLHFYEGLTLKEVAAALELSLGTVKSRLAAGLAHLRTRCAEEMS
jgi:RNA polymerase sigma-70 factor (ECF subfamily)